MQNQSINQPLLEAIARKYSSLFSVDFNDCLGEATYGWLKAQQKFDETRGKAAFQTYAYKAATTEVIRYIQRVEDPYRKLFSGLEELNDTTTVPTYSIPEKIEEVLEPLSADARYLAEYLLKNYETLYADMIPYKIRGMLWKDCENFGWKKWRLEFAMRELKRMFRYA